MGEEVGGEGTREGHPRNWPPCERRAPERDPKEAKQRPKTETNVKLHEKSQWEHEKSQWE
jgi:hypothetical protein